MIVFSIAKGFHKLTKNIPPELCSKERNRLRAIILWDETKDIKFLKDKFRRAKRVRKPRWSYELIIAVKGLRQIICIASKAQWMC